MRTTLNIDSALLKEAERITGERSPSRAVDEALRRLVRQEKIERIIAMAGKIDLDLDDWYEYRHAERT
jgi:Arc/MetJ family transcription regulator